MSDTAAGIRCPRCAELVSDDAAYCSHCGAPLRQQAVNVAPPARRSEDVERIAAELRAALAPRYELLDLLGEGGMGCVFRAREESLRRLVAVKVLAPSLAEDDVARARFTRESRAVAAISHANVIGVHGVGETPGLKLPFIVMQYVDGPTLASWMQTHRRASEATGRRIVGEIASALAAAHSHGVVHRDVKPSNVLIEATTGRAIVVDFGVSALLTPTEATPDAAHTTTTTGVVVGTPVYMSPEQAGGDRVEEPSDVYSLGVVAYELFASELPFKANSAMGWAAAHMRDMPPSLVTRRAEMSPEVLQLVDRCLAKDPSKRPRAHEVATVMAPSIESEIAWPPPGLGPLLGRGHVLGRIAMVLTVAAIVVAVCLTLPPAMARGGPQWWTYYAEGRDVSGSALGVVNETNTAASPVTLWIWRIGLVSGLATFFIAAAAFLLIAGRAAVRAAGARRLGWRWATIADVVVDPDGRNGLLLAGARELAAVTAERRRSALGARREIVGWRLAAGSWSAVALGAWALAAAAGAMQLDGGGALMDWPVLVLVALPAIGAGALVWSAMANEGRLLAPLSRRRLHAPSSITAEGDASTAVATWYAAIDLAGGGSVVTASEPPQPGKLPLLTRLVLAVVAMLAVGGLAGIGLVVVANLVASRNLELLGRETAQLVATMRRLRETDPLGAARRAWVGFLPTAIPLSAAEARREIVRLGRGASASESLPAYPTAPARLLGASANGGARPAVVDAIRAAAKSLAAESASVFVAAAAHPRTEAVRRLSASDASLFTASLDRPLAEYRSLSELPEPPYAELRAGAQANALGAVAAIAQRDYAEAERRLGENAALAERFLAVPRRFSAAFGAGLLQEMALLPLAEVEDLRGDPRPGLELRRAADTVRVLVLDPAWSSRLIGLAATPNDMRTYTVALRDPHLPGGVRAEGFDGGVLGFCLNPREVVSGPQPSRREWVRAAADSISDMSEARELAALVLRGWQKDQPAAAYAEAFGSVLTRIRFCTKIGRN